MVIQHNMQAMNTNRQLGISVGAAAKSTEKLSSGYRINRAGDDAAGLAISEKMRSQIRGLDRASSNSQDGISLIQTAEGALNETQSILQRMRELSVQAANGTNTDSDRNEIQKEVNQLTSEINRIGNTTEFNTMKLLKGNTNKAEIGGVDTETLVEGEKGVTQGAVDNFNVDKNSKKAVDSNLTLVGNQAAATGSLKNEALDEDVAGIAGEYSTARAGGLQFSSTDKNADLNGKEINIVTIDDKTAAGTEYKEGIVQSSDNSKIYVVLKQSTVDDLATAQELITKIQNMASGTNGGTASGNTKQALVDLGITSASGNLKNVDLKNLKMDISLPTEVHTADDLKSFLPAATGSAQMKTDNFGGGRSETIGKYTFELDKTFKEEGDKITVGGETFTTKLSGANAVANEVGLGSSASAITFKLTGTAATPAAGVALNVTLAITGGPSGVTAVDLTNGTGSLTTKTIVDSLKASNDFSADYEIFANEETGYITIAAKKDGHAAADFAKSFNVTLGGTHVGGLELDTGDGTTAASKNASAGIDLTDATISGAGVAAADKELARKVAQSQNLALAMNANANLNQNYFVKMENANDGGGTAAATLANIKAMADYKLTVQEQVNQGGVAKTGTGLNTTLSVAGSGGEDDTITITNPNGMNGIEFEIVTGASGRGDNADGTSFSGSGMKNGAVITQDHTNKNKFYINLGTTANGNKAAKIQQALRDFTQSREATLADGTKVNFKDFEVSSAGNWDSSTTNTSNINHGWSATAGGVEEQKGTYSFDITDALAEGDEIMIAGKKFIAKVQGADINKGELDVSSKDKATQAKKLKDLLGADADIAAKYDIKLVNGTTKLTLIEKAASGEDMKEEDVSVQATGTQGQYKIDEMELQKDGASITIDGQKIDFTSKNAHVGYENGTAIKVTDTVEDQKTALAAAINKNAELSKKYEASVSEDGSLMLTQKVGSEEGPEITTTSSTKGTFDVTFQVGANTGQSMTIAIGDNRANALGVAGDGTEDSIMADNGATAYYTKVSNVTDGTTNDNIEFALDVTSFEKATAAIGVIDDALSSISAQRSQLGAYQNRLEHTIANLDNTSENLQASESRIRDVDMAKEMTNFSKNNILQQAAQSMLAQANQSTQGVLTLLR